MHAPEADNIEVVDLVCDDAAAIVEHLRWWLADTSVASQHAYAKRIRWSVWAVRAMGSAIGVECPHARVAAMLGLTRRQVQYAVSQLDAHEPPELPRDGGVRVLRLHDGEA